MNCYEHTFITRQDLSEVQTKKIVTKYEEIIKNNSGKISFEYRDLEQLDRIINAIKNNY